MHPLILLTCLVASTPGEAQAPAGDSSTPQAAAPAQSAPDSATPAADEPRPLDEFLLIRKNGARIEGHSGSLTAARFTGTSADGKKFDLLPDDIQLLYRKEGSRAGAWALGGAGIGLAISGISVLEVLHESPSAANNSTFTQFSAALIGGTTALGALIGLAIGAGQSRWSVEPLVAPGQRYSLNLSHSL